VRILVDEDVEYPVIERLRQDGHVVESILEQSPGALDLPILARAVQQHMLLLTADHDFGEYVFRDGIAAPVEGIVLYRLGDAITTPRKAEIISDAFARYGDQFADHFSVIDEHSAPSSTAIDQRGGLEEQTSPPAPLPAGRGEPRPHPLRGEGSDASLPAL
jgi:predicted nuclease of predicted toxin-antitoxin system